MILATEDKNIYHVKDCFEYYSPALGTDYVMIAEIGGGMYTLMSLTIGTNLSPLYSDADLLVTKTTEDNECTLKFLPRLTKYIKAIKDGKINWHED